MKNIQQGNLIQYAEFKQESNYEIKRRTKIHTGMGNVPSNLINY